MAVADHVGTLKPGKVADLIAVEGNPLEDIDAAVDVRMTMVGGESYTQDELLAPFTTDAVAAAERRVEAGQPGRAPAAATELTSRADPRDAQRFWWHDPDVVRAAGEHACDAYEDMYRWHRVEHEDH